MLAGNAHISAAHLLLLLDLVLLDDLAVNTADRIEHLRVRGMLYLAHR